MLKIVTFWPFTEKKKVCWLWNKLLVVKYKVSQWRGCFEFLTPTWDSSLSKNWMGLWTYFKICLKFKKEERNLWYSSMTQKAKITKLGRKYFLNGQFLWGTVQHLWDEDFHVDHGSPTCTGVIWCVHKNWRFFTVA